ncbi:hypothetical protein BLA29_010548, partial [Euroglyphus maynei]
LHLYHHSIVPLLGWCAFCIAPTAPCLGIFPFFNTIIHCIMYSYYALSALGPNIQPYLWWKRYITQLQLAQFIIYGLYLIPFFRYQDGYPIKFWRFIAVPQPIIFFYLFYRFYRQSYRMKGQKNSDSKSTMNPQLNGEMAVTDEMDSLRPHKDRNNNHIDATKKIPSKIE